MGVKLNIARSLIPVVVVHPGSRPTSPAGNHLYLVTSDMRLTAKDSFATEFRPSRARFKAAGRTRHISAMHT